MAVIEMRFPSTYGLSLPLRSLPRKCLLLRILPQKLRTPQLCKQGIPAIYGGNGLSRAQCFQAASPKSQKWLAEEIDKTYEENIEILAVRKVHPLSDTFTSSVH